MFEKKIVTFREKKVDNKMLRINSLNYEEKKCLNFGEKVENTHTRVMFISSHWTVLFSICSGVGWRVMHWAIAYDTIDYHRHPTSSTAEISLRFFL